MRLTSVTLAFIFFGTVFATPIHPLRSNAVGLSKRASGGEPMPGLDDGGDGTEDRGRGRGRKPVGGRGGGRGKGKAKQVTTGNVATGDATSDVEVSKSPAGSTKRRKSGQGSRSVSGKRGKSNLVTEEVFVEALRHIKQGGASLGSQSLGVYQITEKVDGRDAVVKIIDDRIKVSEVRTEVKRLNHVGHLLAWGQRKVKPTHFYILMENMGDRVDKMEGLDLENADDQAFIQHKKDTALAQQEQEHQLKHNDPAGNDNYLWKHTNPNAENREDQYQVNVVDWAGATQTGGSDVKYAGLPKLYVVPKDIYAPKESQKSSKKATSSPSDGNSAEEKSKSPPRKSTSKGSRSGLRSSSRNKGETSAAGASQE